jgi:hypothetical protein
VQDEGDGGHGQVDTLVGIDMIRRKSDLIRQLLQPCFEIRLKGLDLSLDALGLIVSLGTSEIAETPRRLDDSRGDPAQMGEDQESGKLGGVLVRHWFGLLGALFQVLVIHVERQVTRAVCVVHREWSAQTDGDDSANSLEPLKRKEAI